MIKINVSQNKKKVKKRCQQDSRQKAFWHLYIWSGRLVPSLSRFVKLKFLEWQPCHSSQEGIVLTKLIIPWNYKLGRIIADVPFFFFSKEQICIDRNGQGSHTTIFLMLVLLVEYIFLTNFYGHIGIIYSYSNSNKSVTYFH